MRNPSRATLRFAAVAMLAPLAFLAQTPTYGHHSSTGYDDHQSVTVTGAVLRYEWSNPHVYIYILQPSDSGQAMQWEIEQQPPSILRRLGWSRDTLHVGDVITVSGMPARNADKKSLYATMIKHGDTTLYDREKARTQLANAQTATSTPTKGLEGTWVTLRTTQAMKQYGEPETLSLTAAGTAALKRFDETKMHPGINCVPYPAPFFMIISGVKKITTGPDVILIDGEFDDARRTIHMNVTTHAGASASIQGHSIGRWEGQSLVIDTMQFAYHSLGNGYGLPSGSQKHMVERLTPAADGTGLTYHFELTDPEFLAAPLSGDAKWEFRPDLKYTAEKCDLDNARRFIQN